MGKENYTLGLYVEECPRMHYKGQFHGSELLCSVSHSFVRLEDVKEKLARHEGCLVEDAAEARRLQEENRECFVESLEQTPFVVVQDELVLMQYEDLREIPSVANVVDLFLDWMPSVEGVLFVVRAFVVC